MSWGERSCINYGGCEHNPTMMSCNKQCKSYCNKNEQHKCNRCGKVQSKSEMVKDTHFPPIIEELNCNECGACFFENGSKTDNSTII